MLPAQSVCLIERMQLFGEHNLRKKFQPQPVRRRKIRRDQIIPRLRRGDHRFALLMKQSREQQKSRLLHLEPAAPFADAALAQNHNLFAAPERIHDHRPFFKSRTHKIILARSA